MVLALNQAISQDLSSLELQRFGVVGYGIHILEINRFQILTEKLGKSFEQYCFTLSERSNLFIGCRRIQFLAGRFAAKEAVIKALGREQVPENSWLNIEIEKLSSGQPSVFLQNRCQEIATEQGVEKWLLSISHTSSLVMTSAIALG